MNMTHTDAAAGRLLAVMNRNAPQIWELSKDCEIAIGAVVHNELLNILALGRGWDGVSEVFKLREDL